MKYHLVIWTVPDPSNTEEIPVIDTEFDSGIDIEGLETQIDLLIEENKAR